MRTLEQGVKDPVVSLGDLDALASLVRLWRPDVVVLVARKMPRLYERFLSGQFVAAEVMSDLSIPYATAHIKDRRIAVVDDIVNVGSTLNNTIEQLKRAGGGAVRCFALGRRAKSADWHRHEEWTYLHDDLLSEGAFTRFVLAVPPAIQPLGKPYDLDFPWIPVRPQPPLSSPEEVLLALRQRLGQGQVRVVTPRPEDEGVRLSLYPDGGDRHSKLRLYYHPERETWSMTPIALDSPLHWRRSTLEGDSKAVLALWDRLASARGAATDSAPDEALARLSLFLQSLAFGVRQLNRLGDVLTPVVPWLIDIDETRWAFADTFERQDLAETLAGLVNDETQWVAEPELSRVATPFRDSPAGDALVGLVRAELEQDAPLASATPEERLAAGFDAVFVHLAGLVGAHDPDEYALGWPHTPEEIRERPYLRLRIGPTLHDLVSILREVTGDDRPSLQRQVSHLLDTAIDRGSVVPTIGVYPYAGGKAAFRVYRGGECPPLDLRHSRIDFAIRHLEKKRRADSKRELSRTRAAKLLATLSYSANPAYGLVPMILPRGTVAAVGHEPLDELAEAWLLARRSRPRATSEPSAGHRHR